MRTTTQLLALLVGVPTMLAAQAPTSNSTSQHYLSSSRWTVDGVYSRLWVPRPYPDKWTTTNAMGARVLWSSRIRANRDAQQATPLVSLGAQFNVTPTETMDFGRYRVTTYGGLVELLPFGAAYRVDPVLSLWTGVVRGTVEDQRLPSSIMKMPEGTTTQFAAAPSLGLRVWLVDRLGFRADYRHTVLRHTRWYGMPEVASGLTVRL